MRTRALSFATILGFFAHSVVAAQSATSNGELAGELQFPPRGGYRHPQAVRQFYDPLTDSTRIQLGLASGSPISLVLRPIVQLNLLATYSGTTPRVAPDSIILTGKVYRLRIFADSQGRASSQASTTTPNPGTQGPTLFFLAGQPTGGESWRASISSTVTGSKEVLRADESGILFRGNRWLTAVANVFDLRKQPNEASVRLYARADSGHLSLSALPQRVRDLLREGFRLTITEDAHRIAIPTGALLHVASAPSAVRSRFGDLDFTIEGDELDAVRDFASRLAPVGAPVAAVGSRATTAPSNGASEPTTSTHVTIASGTAIVLSNSYAECAQTLKPGHNHLATVATAVDGGGGAVIPAEASVLLVVREVRVNNVMLDSSRIAMDASLLAFNGRSYPLEADVVEMSLEPAATGRDVCIPKDGRIVIRLRSPLMLEP